MRNAHDWNFRLIVSHTRTFYMQDWFAFTGNGSEFNFSRAGEVNFPNSGIPKAENNYGFCQVSVAISVPVFFKFYFNLIFIIGNSNYLCIFTWSCSFRPLKNENSGEAFTREAR